MSDYLTTSQAASIAKCSPDTIIAMIHNGLPATKVGRVWAVRERDLREFVPRWQGILSERSRVAAVVRWQKAEQHMKGRLSVKEAAERAKVSESTIWDWCNEYDLAHERVAGNGSGATSRIAIEPAALDAFVAAWPERRNGRMAAARKTWANLSIDAPSAPPVQHPHQMFSSQPTFGQVHGSTEGAMTFDAHPATCAAPQGVCANPGCGRSCALIGAYCLDCTWQGYGREPDIWPPEIA